VRIFVVDFWLVVGILLLISNYLVGVNVLFSEDFLIDVGESDRDHQAARYR
jgi:hypothetical protein